MPVINQISQHTESTQYGDKNVYDIVTTDNKTFHSYVGKWNSFWAPGVEITANPEQWKQQKDGRYFLMAPPEARPQQNGGGSFTAGRQSFAGQRPSFGGAQKPGGGYAMDFKQEITDLKYKLSLLMAVLGITEADLKEASQQPAAPGAMQAIIGGKEEIPTIKIDEE